jgi:type IV secretion system protein VirB6
MSGPITLFTYFYSEFDAVLSGYISEKSADIITAISPTAWIMLGIYIVLWGFSAMRGQIDEPITDALFRMLKIALVLGIALNVGRYQEYVVDFVMDTPAALSQVLVLGNTNPEVGDASTYGMIDDILNKTLAAANKAWDQMSVFSPGQAMGLGFAAILVLLFGLFFTLTAGIMILLAKAGMVLLLAIGPIFILLAMFQATQRFFEQWLAQVITSMLTLVLLLACCAMFFGMVEQAIGLAANVIEKDPLQAVATVSAAGTFCTFLLFQAGPLASAMASGLALPIGQAAKKLSGIGMAESLGHSATHRVVGKGIDKLLALKTGGASVLAKNAITRTAGTAYKATNSIKRG